MYYVCENIVKPLTKPYQLSYAEFVGPSDLMWFVSHYWGTPFRHFVDSIRKHAETAFDSGEWGAQAYWICTLSNNQWQVLQELGGGMWQESSFYLALRSGLCKGTAMIIDQQALPLSRAWCLFEVLQTLLLSAEEQGFRGLLLCTQAGVLNDGQGSADVAMAIAERLATLDMRSAEASCEDDKRMIHALVERMPGGFDSVNGFVRTSIRDAVHKIGKQFQKECDAIVGVLGQSTVGANALYAQLRDAPRSPQPVLLSNRAYGDKGDTNV